MYGESQQSGLCFAITRSQGAVSGAEYWLLVLCQTGSSAGAVSDWVLCLGAGSVCWCLVLGAWCCVYVLVLGAGAVPDLLLVLCPGAGVDGRCLSLNIATRKSCYNSNECAYY